MVYLGCSSRLLANVRWRLRRGERLSRHPSKSTVDNLTAALGGPGARTVSAFDGPSCAKGVSHLANFVDVPTSDTLWATERDGDVVLTTTGDGMFTREQAVARH